jgi:cardiolipin synthase
MWSDLLARNWVSLHGLVSVLALGIYLVASRTLRQRRHPSAAIAWFVSLALMPYLALPLYFLFGNRKVARPLHPPRVQTLLSSVSLTSPTTSRIQILAGTLGLPRPSSYAHFRLHEDGSHALRALISLIDSASTTLDLCTFLLGRDVLGQDITRHLIQKVQQGVRVRLMIDGIGRYLGGHPDLRVLTMAGVRVSLFVPPLASRFPGRTNLRNHRKMVIADGRRIWLGGRNLAAEYFEGDPSLGGQKTPWVDLSFELSGAIAMQAQELFNHDWAFVTQTRGLETSTPWPPEDRAIESSTVQLVPSGPDQAEDTVYTLLISSCFAAQTRILAVSPYFVPDATLQMALTLAARRGIAVDLILPRQSNHRLADMARHAALRELAASGARVWLVPEMVHAKAMVIDGEFALSGTANLDERSLFLNYELMVAFYKPADVQQFAAWIERLRERACLYQAHPPGVMREFAEGVVRWLAFQL